MTAGVVHHKELSALTTLKVGGSASAYAQISTDEDIVSAVSYAREHGLALYPLGGGSNILAHDEGYDGLIVHMCTKGITHISTDATTTLLRAKAGECFDDVVAYSVTHGLWGLENLSHIPGTVGATPVQNVGAYGVEVGDYITEVVVYDTQTHEFKTLAHEACAFAYRDSLFKHEAGKQLIITEVVFTLHTVPAPKLMYRDLAQVFSGESTPAQATIRDAIIAIRTKKFPNWNTVGTAGSFFKNPIVSQAEAKVLAEAYPELPQFAQQDGRFKVSLGYILDKVVGLRGYTEGHVRLFENQALVLVAENGATASEIRTFAASVTKKVFDVTGIKIEMEVTQL